MAKYVLKFGGTSLKDSTSIKKAHSIISDFYDKKKPEQLVVVVSAPGKIGEGKLESKITNLLEEIYYGKNVDENKNEIVSRMDSICIRLEINQPMHLYSEIKREIGANKNNDESYSRIVSNGEKLMVHTLSEYSRRELSKRKINVKSFDFKDFGMITNNYKDAYTTEDATLEIEKRLKGVDGILIIPGFIGYNEEYGEITTMGRDGSNYTATKIAEAINAKGVYIFSDEPGVKRANPKFVPDAEIIKELSYDEAIEFAELGAKIINAKSIYPAKNENIPIYIVDENYNGTKISNSVNLENRGAKIIASSSNNYIINVKYKEDKPGVLVGISGYFRKAGINIESIADERHSLSFAFTKKGNENLEFLINNIGKDYNFNLENSFSRISLIGEGMKNQVGVIKKISYIYENKGISFEMISQGINQLNITTFIKQEHERIAVKGLYDGFFRNHNP